MVKLRSGIPSSHPITALTDPWRKRDVGSIAAGLLVFARSGEIQQAGEPGADA